jgi:hypothetical protein
VAGTFPLPPVRAFGVASSAAPTVFLSYAHTDSAIALSLREALASRGLTVLFDDQHLKPSENIGEFVRDCVRTADATICLVSTSSLSSAWVVFEAVTTLHKEYVQPGARLVAIALDTAFFAADFRLEITRSLNQKIDELDDLLRQYLEQQLDLNDISVERSLLLRMKAGLGDLLERLRSNLTLTLVGDNVIECATRVADYIRELRGQRPSRTDPRDIRSRARELRSHLWEGRTDDALDRMLDFVREFSDLPKHVRDATSIANTLRRIEKLEGDGRLSFDEAEKQRQPAIYRLLELIDEIELYPQLPVAS